MRVSVIGQFPWWELQLQHESCQGFPRGEQDGREEGGEGREGRGRRRGGCYCRVAASWCTLQQNIFPDRTRNFYQITLQQITLTEICFILLCLSVLLKVHQFNILLFYELLHSFIYWNHYLMVVFKINESCQLFMYLIYSVKVDKKILFWKSYSFRLSFIVWKYL